MWNADLRDANLFGAKLLSENMLTGVTWGNTTCSDGSNSDDDDGDNFTCESNFIVNQLPTANITSPKDGAKVSRWWGTTIRADADDPEGGFVRVEFYADGAFLGYDVFPPYRQYWRPDSTGFHTLTVKAIDETGLETTSDPVTVRVR